MIIKRAYYLMRWSLLTMKVQYLKELTLGILYEKIKVKGINVILTFIYIYIYIIN